MIRRAAALLVASLPSVRLSAPVNTNATAAASRRGITAKRNTWTKLAAVCLLGLSAAAAHAVPGVTVTSVSPNSGTTAGGTTNIIITGTAFSATLANDSVSFGGTAGTITAATSTQLTVTSPAHAAGTIDIQVTVAAGGTSPVNAPADQFTFVSPTPATLHYSGTGTTQLASGLNAPYNVTVDRSGNVYFTDAGSGAVKEILAVNGVIPSSPTINTLGAGFVQSEGIAVDSSGNVYVTDVGTGQQKVYEMTPGCTAGNVATCKRQLATDYTFSGPDALALDSSGNVYVVDSGNNAVVELTPNCITSCETLLANSSDVNGFSAPDGVAVDAAGNVYVSDGNNAVVKELPPNCANTCTITTLATGFGVPTQLQVDDNGNVYVADFVASKLYEILAVNGVIPASPTVRVLASGLQNSNGVAVDGSGNVYYTAFGSSGHTVSEIHLGPVNFGTVSVGVASPIVGTFTFDSAGTIAAPVVLTQGATALDFTDAGTGTCTTQGTSFAYAIGNTCTVTFNLTPKHPGLRMGAAQILSGGVIESSVNLYGVGTGPQVIYGPATQTTLGSGFTSTADVAVDGSGNVYVADFGHNLVKEMPPNCSGCTITTLGGGFGMPNGLAVDGAGNIYIADEGHNLVKEMTPGCASITCVTTLGAGFNTPTGIAVDGSGNVYVGDQGTNSVKEMTPNCASGSTACITTLGSGFSHPTGVAVDSSGNVYVADFNNNAVKEMTPNCFSCTITTLGGTINQPADVAVDAAGNVYVATFFSGSSVKEMTPNCATSACVTSLGSGFGGPFGVAVDGNDNVYVADLSVSQVKELNVSTAPTLTFATATPAGTTDATDGVKTVTITNDGNATLNIAPATSGFNPSVGADFTYATGGGSCPQLSTISPPSPLIPDASCTIGITFTPLVATGIATVSEQAVLTDNNLNVTSNTQTISLNGSSLAPLTTTPIVTITAVSSPVGTLVTTLNASIAYTPTPGASPTGTFTFQIGAGPIATASCPAVTTSPLLCSALYNTSALTPVAGGYTITGSLAADSHFNTASGTNTLTILQTSFVVNSTVDPGSGTPASCFAPGNGWNGFNCSLRDAFAAVATLPGGTVANITFDSTAFATHQTITIGSTNTLITGPQTLTVTGPGIGLLTLTGAVNTIFLGNSAGATLNMSAMTVANSLNIEAISNAGTMSLSGMVFSGNADTAGIGGAIQNNGSLTIDKSTFSGNSAVFGAAIGSISTSTVLTITNSTFTGNTTTGFGGGLYLAGPVTTSLTNDTFSGNSAGPLGGAIYAGSTNPTTLNNVTIANNTTAGAAIAEASSGGVVIHNSIVTDAASHVAATVCTSCTTDASDFIGGNALLAPLGNYGGPTQTMVPFPGSGALQLDSSSTANKDQRGVTRATTGANSSDAGAVQAVYGITFSTQPALPGATTPVGTNFTAAVTLTENGGAFPVTGTISLPVTLSTGAGTLSGSPITSITAGVATGTFQITASGAADKLTATAETGASVVSNAFAVTPGPATHFSVTAPSTATAGVTFSPVTVTALDALGNTATGYAGLVHFTSSDTGISVALPSNSTITAGVGTFSGKLVTSGTQTITATDTVTPSITGVSGNITISPNVATHMGLSVPGTAAAGTPFTATVTMLDQFNNTATSFTGTIHFSSTDGSAVLPSDYLFVAGDNGVHAFTNAVTLKTAGLQTVSVSSSGLTSATNNITVSSAVATHFTVAAPGTATAGVAFTATVTALDQFGNTATGYLGIIHFTSTDGAAVLPANYTFLAGDSGVHAFTTAVTLKTSGTRTIIATDTVTPSITGTSSNITVSAAAATHFTLVATSAVTAGAGGPTVVVTALDAFGNTATGYTGTVTFTSTDASAVLPSTYTFLAGDNGVHTFPITLKTAGSKTVTATDTVTGSITGTSNSITVSAASVSHLSVSAPGTATAGTAFTITVTALDAFNNTVTTYTDPVHFTTTDATATVPVNYTFVSGDNGVHVFTNLATLNTSGSQTITATDTILGTINGTSSAIVVGTGVATKVVFGSTPATPVVSGTAPGTVTVKIEDAAGNVITTNSTSIVTLTITASSFTTVTLNVTAVNGIGTFTPAALTAVNTYSFVGSSAGLTSTATATEVVNPAAPIAGAVTTSVLFNSTNNSIPIVLTGGAAVSVAVSTGAQHGTTSVSGLGITYTPNNGYTGPDTFSYTATNVTNTSAPALVTITVGKIPANVTLGSATPVYNTNPQNATATSVSTFTSLTVTVSSYTFTYTQGGVTLSGPPTGAGTYGVTATIVDPTYQGTVTGTFTISKQASVTALALSTNTINPNQPVTLTATVASAITGTPTGSVNFFDGGTLLNPAPIALSFLNTASLTVNTLAAGQVHTLTASYVGDSNFTASSSTATAGTAVTVAPLDFSFQISTSSTSTATVIPGAAGGYTFNVLPLFGGFPGVVTFTVSGLPAGYTFSFSPSSLPASTSASVPVTLTINVPVSTATARPAPRPGTGYLPVALGVLLLPFAAARRLRKSKAGRNALLALLLFVGMGAMAAITGCGADYGVLSSAPQSYNLVITATSGGIQHATNVTLNVQ